MEPERDHEPAIEPLAGAELLDDVGEQLLARAVSESVDAVHHPHGDHVGLCFHTASSSGAEGPDNLHDEGFMRRRGATS